MQGAPFDYFAFRKKKNVEYPIDIKMDSTHEPSSQN